MAWTLWCCSRFLARSRPTRRPPVKPSCSPASCATACSCSCGAARQSCRPSRRAMHRLFSSSGLCSPGRCGPWPIVGHLLANAEHNAALGQLLANWRTNPSTPRILGQTAASYLNHRLIAPQDLTKHVCASWKAFFLAPPQSICEASLVVSGRRSDVAVRADGEPPLEKEPLPASQAASEAGTPGPTPTEGGTPRSVRSNPGAALGGAVFAVLTRAAWSNMCARAHMQVRSVGSCTCLLRWGQAVPRRSGRRCRIVAVAGASWAPCHICLPIGRYSCQRRAAGGGA